MSFLSMKLFGHCSNSSDFESGNENDSPQIGDAGVNPATGLPLRSNGVKGCLGAIDVAGNPLGVDLSDNKMEDNFIHPISSIHDDTQNVYDDLSTSVTDNSCFDDFGWGDISTWDGDL